MNVLQTTKGCRIKYLLFATGGWSGNNAGHKEQLGDDVVPVSHSGPDTVSGSAFLPRKPSLPPDEPGRGKESGNRWVSASVASIRKSQEMKSTQDLQLSQKSFCIYTFHDSVFYLTS